MKTDFTSLKKQIADLHSAIAEKIAQRQTLTAEIAALNAAPPDKTAVVALLHQFVDEQAAKYPASLQMMVSGFVNNWQKADYLKRLGLPLLHTAKNLHDPNQGYSASPEGIFYLLRAAIKDAVEQAVDTLEWPAEGVDTSTRLERLNGLSARLSALDCELTTLYDHCAGLGLALPDTTLSAEERETRRRAALAAQRKPNKVEILSVDLPGDTDFNRPKSQRARSTESPAEQPNVAFAPNYENEGAGFRPTSAAESPDACEAADLLSGSGFPPARDSLPPLRTAAL